MCCSSSSHRTKRSSDIPEEVVALRCYVWPKKSKGWINKQICGYKKPLTSSTISPGVLAVGYGSSPQYSMVHIPIWHSISHMHSKKHGNVLYIRLARRAHRHPCLWSVLRAQRLQSTVNQYRMSSMYVGHNDVQYRKKESPGWASWTNSCIARSWKKI